MMPLTAEGERLENRQDNTRMVCTIICTCSSDRENNILEPQLGSLGKCRLHILVKQGKFFPQDAAVYFYGLTIVNRLYKPEILTMSSISPKHGFLDDLFSIFNARQHPIVLVEESALRWMGLRVSPIEVNNPSPPQPPGAYSLRI